jgi:lauroyl/myristoyl acyltransferase
MGERSVLERLATRALAGVGARFGGQARPTLCDLARRAGLGPRMNGRQLRDNLRLFFPQQGDDWIEATARAVEANSIQAKFLDKHILPHLSAARLERDCELVNCDALEQAMREGRGIVIVSLHYGRFWAAPVWLSSHGARVFAFQKADGRLPAPDQTLSGGSFNASDMSSALRATRALRKGAVVALQLDAGRVQSPLVVDFLDRPTLVTASPIHLAKAADAIVIPMLAIASSHDRSPIRLTSYEAIDPRRSGSEESAEASLGRVLARFEDQVRSDPSQWYGVATAHRRIADRAPSVTGAAL